MSQYEDLKMDPHSLDKYLLPKDEEIRIKLRQISEANPNKIQIPEPIVSIQESKTPQMWLDLKDAYDGSLVQGLAKTVGTAALGAFGLNKVGQGLAFLDKVTRANKYLNAGRTLLDAGLTVDGLFNLATENGVQKTIREAKAGNTWNAVKSGVGDALDLLGAGDLVGIGYRYFNPNNTIRLQKFLTNNQLKHNPTYDNSEIEQLKNYLKTKNVDVEQFSNGELNTMLAHRKRLLKETAPKVYNIVHPNKDMFTVVGYNRNWDPKNYTGSIVLKNNLRNIDNKFHVKSIYNITQEYPDKVPLKGVSEQLYNAAIIADKQMQNKGIITGELLKQPEKTTKVLSKFADKKLISNNGRYEWKAGITENNPIYLFVNPTYQTPVKSILFDPKTINRKGKMKIDWNNINIYK